MILTVYQALSVFVAVAAVLGPIGTIAAIIFAPAVAVPVIKALVTKFLGCRFCIVIVTIIVASVISFWVGRHEVRQAYARGVADTIAKVARGDAKVVGKAKAGRIILQNCEAQNMDWDQTTGKCK